MSADFDVCVIGSGAGGAPVAAALSAAGHSVVVLEKGPWLSEKDFFKDEIAASRREIYIPHADEPQVVETKEGDGWHARTTPGSGWNFWNGSMVGGAGNLMSGFFHRLHPDDFRLRSVYGDVDGADVVDWPISYNDLDPWYELAAREIGVSGRGCPHPPLEEHPIAGWIDKTCVTMGLNPTPVPRAILSEAIKGRSSCSYTGFCAGYGCATGAKGSPRAALLDRAVLTGRCEVRPDSMVRRLAADSQGRIARAEYYDEKGKSRSVSARVYVLACQAIETARLLLLSSNSRHPKGLANSSGLVGRNLLFTTTAWAEAALPFDKFDAASQAELASAQPWINRSIQDWYSYKNPKTGKKVKGGSLEFMLAHPNFIGQAVFTAFHSEKGPLWGTALKRSLEEGFRRMRHVVVEVFADWMPNPDCYVTLDPDVKDKWGIPVARVRVGRHPHNKQVADFLLDKGVDILSRLGGERIVKSSRGAPATNLAGGTCRFGRDPKSSALDVDCRAHDVKNLFVTDASFMPTGGSAPFTWTIYANSFRVAEVIRTQLAGRRA